MPGPSSLRLSMTAMPISPSPPCWRASTTSARLRAGTNLDASAALRGREIHGLHAASCSAASCSRDQNASPTPLGRRQRHRPGFSCHNGPCTPRSAVSHSICAGGIEGGRDSPVRETTSPLHLTKRSCSKGPRHYVAPARIITPALRSWANDFIVFERLHRLRTCSPSSHVPAADIGPGTQRWRFNATPALQQPASRIISTAKSKNEADPQDPTIRQLTLS